MELDFIHICQLVAEDAYLIMFTMLEMEISAADLYSGRNSNFY
jgi:hypothetical protein